MLSWSVIRLVVNAIKANLQNWSRYGQIVKDNKDVLRALKSQQIFHTKREISYVAHGLTKATIK